MTQNERATPLTVVNLIHSRLSPTRPFSKRSPTLYLPTLHLTLLLMKKFIHDVGFAIVFGGTGK
ncbi:MAG: hypothetical protein LBK82_06945 [Planctomycetaceae bacterium]|nr:hypothetical protein [Planctomycetaceae bacterium]